MCAQFHNSGGSNSGPTVKTMQAELEDSNSANNKIDSPLPVGQHQNYGSCINRSEKVGLSVGNNSTTGKRSISNSEASVIMAEEKSWLQRAAKSIPCLGIILAICASFFLGSAGMLVKMTRSVHGIQVAVFRAMIQLLIYGSIISLRGLPFVPRRNEFIPVMGRAFLGATSITFSYYALRLIPLGDATTIRFSLPIWTLIVGYLVLGEQCSLLKICAVIISISGVVLIAKPDDCVHLLHLIMHSLRMESDNSYDHHLIDHQAALDEPARLSPTNEPYKQLEGCLLALSSSICLSLSLIALRLCKRTPAEITILWLSIISIVIGSGALLLLNEWRMPNNWLDVVYILLNGLCGSIGQWFITSALKVEQSGVIALARTFDIQVAFLYSATLLHEHIRLSSIIGSALVSFGVVAVVVPKWLNVCQTGSEDSNSADKELEQDQAQAEQQNCNSATRQQRL